MDCRVKPGNDACEPFMTDPVLVEVTRGERVESEHRGAIAVIDADGSVVMSVGDIDTPRYPRSAVKAMQSLVLVESGAADAFGFGDAELALACASHGGEPDHVATAAHMLKQAGLDATCLECGAHWPMNDDARMALARSGGEPTALHNNCSGKHAGFLCAATTLGEQTRGYVAADHPIQMEIKAILEDVTRHRLTDKDYAIDGCAIPTYAIPLRALAVGFARFGSGQGLVPGRVKAARRLLEACAAKPWYVAGTGRFDTEVMEHFGRRVFVKTGAEGVYCGAIPELGLGIALKCDDGATRASEVAMANVLAQLLTNDADRAALARWTTKPIRSVKGVEVGGVRPVPTAYTAPG
jgi:L-asparaginase II